MVSFGFHNWIRLKSPLGLDRSDEFWQVGNVENHQQLLKADGGSHQDPSVLLEFFSVLEVFGQFDESCGHRKKVTQKQTHFRDLQDGGFSVWIS